MAGVTGTPLYYTFPTSLGGQKVTLSATTVNGVTTYGASTTVSVDGVPVGVGIAVNPAAGTTAFTVGPKKTETPNSIVNSVHTNGVEGRSRKSAVIG